MKRGSIPKGFRKALRSELQNCRERLERGSLGQKDVHEIRKSLKRIQAGLHIAKRELGAKQYSKSRAGCRAASRRLSPLRDQHILSVALNGLLRRNELAISRREKTVLRQQMAPTSERIGNVIPFPLQQRLARSLKKAAREPLHTRIHRPDLEAELRHAYKQAQEAFAQICDNAQDAAVHRFRKKVKRLHYELALWRKRSKKLEKTDEKLDQLGDELGKHHDLVVLGKRLKGLNGVSRSTTERLRSTLSQEKEHRLRAGLALGARIFKNRWKKFISGAKP